MTIRRYVSSAPPAAHGADPDLDALRSLLALGRLAEARVIADRLAAADPPPSESRRVSIGEVLLAQGFLDEAAPWFTPNQSSGASTDGALEIRQLAGRYEILVGKGESSWRVANRLTKRCEAWSVRSPDRRWWALCLLQRLPHPQEDDEQRRTSIFATQRRLRERLTRSPRYRRAFWYQVPGRQLTTMRSFTIEQQMQDLVAALGPDHPAVSDFLDRKDVWDPQGDVDWRQLPKQDEMRWALYQVAAQNVGRDSVITARLALAATWVVVDQDQTVQHADWITAGAQVLEANLCPGHPDVIAGWRLAASAVGHASPAAARAIHERLLAIADQHHGRSSLIAAQGLRLLADSLAHEEDHERAMECRREALMLLLHPNVLPEFELELVSQDPVVGEHAGGHLHRLGEQIAEHLQKTGRGPEAIPLLRSILVYAEQEFPSSPVPAWTMALLAEVEQQAGHQDAALHTYERTWQRLVTNCPHRAVEYGSALDWDELDDSGRRGPDLIRRVAAAYSALLRACGRNADGASVDGEVEHLAKQYAPARPPEMAMALR